MISNIGNQSPGILLINGFPGSGKTTVARALAAGYSRSGCVNGDDIHNLVVGGRIHPPGNVAEIGEVDRQLALREINIAALADNLFDAGFFPVIDNFMSNKRRLHHLLACIRSTPIAMVVLDPGLQTCMARDRARLEKNVAHLYQRLYGELLSELKGIGLWLDTRRMTVEQTAIEVRLRAFAEGVVRK